MYKLCITVWIGLLAAVSAFVQHSNSLTYRRKSAAVRLRMGTEKEKPERDIVERFVAFFFGEQALDDPSPMGMSRININTFPDQYPATKDRWAEPVAGDNKDMQLIRPMLAQTCLETRKLKCVYDASKNGWRASAFHRGVDKMGPGVILAKTKGGAVVGGYNPKGWVGEAEYRPGLSAFLFTWADGDLTKRPVKLRKIGGAGLAVVDKPTTGPYFGADGFCVPLDKNDEKRGESKLGSYYERLPNSNSIFAPSEGGRTQLTELKAFMGVYEKGEYIPFDDVIPFSIT